MGKAGRVFVFIVLLAGGWTLVTGQQIPKPPPEKNPHAWADSDRQYPSARVCGECHPRQFEQWSLSSHAYANLSPMFNKFEQKINDLASGTINSFCVRCHASVGTALGEPRHIAWWDRSPASREGITCVTCHRIGEGYGKTNAARRITPGSIHEPVFGPFDTTGGLKAISNAMGYGLLVSPDQANRPDEPDGKKWIRIHQTAIQSDILVKSEFCVTCHQVQVHPGIKLETVWEEYRNSPAAKDGTTCQQCHMSPTPGQPTPFTTGWAARVNGQYVNQQRPLTDHTFVGPGYPISHPGLFPFRIEESPFTPQQWLKFDYRAKWGSDAFESAPSAVFPPEWQNPADRRKAWTIVQENLKRWDDRKQMRLQLLENGSRLDGPFFDGPPTSNQALSFNYKLTNLNKGPQPAVRLTGSATGALAQCRAHRSGWRKADLGVGLSRPVRRHGRHAVARRPRAQDSVRRAALQHAGEIHHHQREGNGSGDVPADQSRFRPVTVHPARRHTDLAAQPSAVRTHGEAQHPAAGEPSREVQSPGGRSEEARDLPTRNPHARPDRTDLLHGFRGRHDGHEVGRERLGHRHPRLCRRVPGALRGGDHE
jgi:hypothetical protein